MKRVYVVELGTESSTGAIDDPTQWEFHDQESADVTAYYMAAKIKEILG